MNLLVKAVNVLDSRSPYHGQTVDIHIEDGYIKALDTSLPGSKHTEVITYHEPVTATPGWFDFSAHFCDPGHEYKEGLGNGCQLLTQSGFTGAGILPNTSPVIQRKTDVAYLLSQSATSPVDLSIYGAITADCQGEELTEMIDMHHAGVSAFTDGIHPVHNADILLKTLLYLRKFNGLLIQRPADQRLDLYGHMHEGIVSTVLGLKGMPALSEAITIKRDLDLLRYAGGKLHFTAVSTAEGVELIAAAKKEGLRVTCDVAIHQLLLTHDALTGYDTNYKVNPPLRTEEDRRALLSGVRNGTIDVITSHHIPQDEENKKMEFDLADYGMIGIQTFASLLFSLTGEVSADTLVKCCSVNPRKILNLEQPVIDTDRKALISLYRPKHKWQYTPAVNISESANSPFLGQELTGKAAGIINGRKHYFNIQP